MTDIIPVKEDVAARALYTKERYEREYRRSVDDPQNFWKEVAARIDWVKSPTKIKDVSFKKEDFRIRWFEDGKLNAAYNCIDRHLPERENDVAIIWEGDDPNDDRHITYGELHAEVCRMANILKARNVKRGDRVIIYMPMIPEAAYAMLACARIGAVHSVVFGGFSPDSLASRIDDCAPTAIVTADEGLRGGKKIPLKRNVDAALAKTDGVRLVLVVKRTGGDIAFSKGRDLWWHESREDVPAECPAEVMNAEDPLFILYTSGSTGKPKGVLHTTGGYLVYA
ncbi:MAG TPA: AMP-binding protein, partial [Parvularculaceae bacterium]|nr:AMP-binding protein [Parvularculaceae bacterium]